MSTLSGVYTLGFGVSTQRFAETVATFSLAEFSTPQLPNSSPFHMKLDQQVRAARSAQHHIIVFLHNVY